MNTENTQNDNHKDNAELIYQHTLNIVKEKRESIVRLDTKTGALLAFGGFSLRSIEIPYNAEIFQLSIYNAAFWYLGLKIFSYIFVLLSTWFCIRGLIVIKAGGTASPTAMLKAEIFDRDITTNKCSLIRTWDEVTKEYEKILEGKEKRLNIAFNLMFFSIITSVAGALISAFFTENS
ncbi:hypothetical protein [Aphanizomenon flos-aquae]|uniref:hypothetical protein n=1 Tax=Aphanizomenon flos-aquae TaxID=1176 RepID=UPI0004851A1E|nr:hypothetical protein [Aphanizomenon flos-aquae]